MSCLIKITRHAKRHEIGLLHIPEDDLFVDTPHASLNLLMDHSFPDSLPLPDDPTTGLIGPEDHHFHSDPVSWINEDLIRAVFRRFKDFKAPRPDSFAPFKHLPPLFLHRLRKIYTAVYTCGYTPISWRNSKATLIPKPGKDDYGLPSAYWPISLMSFVFKGFKRLIYWRLLNTSLKDQSLLTNTLFVLVIPLRLPSLRL